MSIGLCCIDKIDNVLTFNITNGKDKGKEYVSMATKRGYLSNIFGSLNWQISIQIIFLQQRWD